MPASFTWQPGPTGGTAMNAANLNRLAVTADIGTAGTPTGDAARAALGLSVVATVSASDALAVGKFTPVDATAVARSMTLPTGAADGVSIGVEKVDASANVVSVTGNIRGVPATTITLPWQHETLLLRADSTGSWWPVAGHKTKASLDAAYDAAGAAAAAQARTVRTFSVLSTPNGTTPNNPEALMRYPELVPFVPTRWRLHVRNYQTKAATPVLAGATFTATYVGDHASDANGAGTGGFAAAPVQALPGFTLPADGSEYVSAWVTSPTMMPKAYTPWLLSIAYSGGGAAGQALGDGYMYWSSAVGSSGHVGDQAVFGAGLANTLFDIRVEYDAVIPASGLSVLAIGDSITKGISLPPAQSWPGQFSTRTGNTIINAGVGGALLAEWITSSRWMWGRVAGGTYDAAIVSLGTNDIASASTLSQCQGWFVTVAANLRALGVGRIYAAPVTPRGFTHGRLAASSAIGATSLSVADFLSNGSYRFGEGPNAETVTVSACTGTGPWTATVGATTKLHQSGEPLISATEQTRVDFNTWLRGLPAGISGVLDFDTVLMANYDRAIIQPEFVTSGGLHPNAAGYALMASVVNLR